MIIYKVTFPNSKVYVGLTTTTLKKRKIGHYSKMRKGYTQYFYNALRKYQGQESWEIIDETENFENLKKLEIHYIDFYKSYTNGYNLTKGGDGTVGYRVTEQGRLSMSKAKIGRTPWNKGKKQEKQSEEECKRKSERANKIWAKKLKRQFQAFKNNELIGIWVNQQQCARDLNLKTPNINKCLKNIRRETMGYSFKWLG